MAVSTDTLLARIAALEQRVSDLAQKVRTDETTLGGILTTAGRASFLSQLSQLPHQTTANANIGATGANWTTAERTAVNGAINALNTLQTNLQGKKYEA